MIDIEEFKKLIALQLQENTIKHCEKGKHSFVPANDGTLDVKCVKCGVRAMRATLKNTSVE